MPDTMIERAAKALYERFPHGQLVTDSQGKQALTGIPWAELGLESRSRWIDDARAVVTAMHKPTDGILKAMRDTVPVDGHEWEYMDEDARAHWSAMIDAALAEQP